MTEQEKKAFMENIDERLVEYTQHLEQARYSVEMFKKLMGFLQTTIPNYQFAEFEELAVLNDFHSYTLFSLLDLYVAVKGLIVAKSDWERIFFIKHGYFIVFESLDTYYRHNTKIKKLISGNYPSMQDKFKVIATEIKAYTAKHGYREKMAAMRNSIIAHIGTTFVDYYDGILRLNGESGMEAALSFMVILQHLQEFLADFVSETNIEWKETGNKQKASIENYMTKIETLFQHHSSDTIEMVEMKNNLLKEIASIRNNLETGS